MSTKNKIINVNTGEVRMVRLHPSTNESRNGNPNGDYRSRLLALHRAGWRLANGRDR